MPKSRDYVFVLWGDQFDGVAATIFVTELRKAGLRVKIVGLASRRLSGTHGLALVPDLTLDQALPLAGRAICLIIPHTSPGLKRLQNDPRLREFLSRAQANNARFVIGQLKGADLAALDLLPLAADQVRVYPHSEDLVAFAQEVAASLVAV